MTFLPTATIDAKTAGLSGDLLLRRIFTDEAARERQDTAITRRDTYEFGYSYSKMRDGDYTFTIIPTFLRALRRKAVDALVWKSGTELPQPDAFNNCIVSDYRAGDKLQPHVDEYEGKPRKPGENVAYHFGENVIGVIIKADTKGRLYFVESGSETKHPLEERDGMAFLINGKWRHEPFRHGVSEVENRRVSVTYRTTHFSKPI